MFTKIVKRGFENRRYDLFIATMRKSHNEHSYGAVASIVGKAKVSIRSNVASWGGVPIKGRENIKLLRDALIKICKMEGIK